MTVTAAQRQALLERGLNDAIIEFCRIHTIDVAAATTLGVPPERRSSGPFLAAPGRDENDWRTEGHPVYDKNFKLANDCTLPYWSPLVELATWDDPTRPLLICRDIFEANAFAYHGFAALTHDAAPPCEALLARATPDRQVIVIDDGTDDNVLRALAVHRLCVALRAREVAVATVKVAVAAWGDPELPLLTVVVADAKPWLPAFEMLKAAIDTKDERAPFKVVETFAFRVATSEASDAELDEIHRLAKKVKISRRTLTHGIEAVKKQLAKFITNPDQVSGERVSAIGGGTYIARNGRVFYQEDPDPNSPMPPPIEHLASFDMRIIKEMIYDDGFSTERVYEVTGKTSTDRTLLTVRVKATDFSDLDWIQLEWGNMCVLPANRQTQGQIREAAQLFSRPEYTRIYRQTGWRENGGEMIFLHAGGAIGKDNVFVSMRDYEDYTFPEDPPSLDEIRDATAYSFKLLECGSPELMFPLLGAAGLAPLREFCPTDFVPWVFGLTGLMKTERCMLVQHFFRTSRNSIQWSSTENAIERVVSQLSGVIVLIDDYAPQPDQRQQQILDGKVERVVRAIGNQSGRERLSRGGEDRQKSWSPRALAISTGEQLPREQSICARTFPIQVDDPKPHIEAITEMQHNVDRLPIAMYGYIDFIRTNWEYLKSSVPARVIEMRAAAAKNATHLRFSAHVAKLFVGLDVYLEFAHTVGAIDHAEWMRLRDEGFAAISANTERNMQELIDSGVYARFIKGILDLLDTSAATIGMISTVSCPSIGFVVTSGEHEGSLAIRSTVLGEIRKFEAARKGHFNYTDSAVRAVAERAGWAVRDVDGEGAVKVRHAGRRERVWIVPAHIASDLGLMDRVEMVVSPIM